MTSAFHGGGGPKCWHMLTGGRGGGSKMVQIWMTSYLYSPLHFLDLIVFEKYYILGGFWTISWSWNRDHSQYWLWYLAEPCETMNCEQYRFWFQSWFWRSNGSDTDSRLSSWDPTILIPIQVSVLEIEWFRYRFWFQSWFWRSNDSNSDTWSRTLKRLILQWNKKTCRSLYSLWHFRYSCNLTLVLELGLYRDYSADYIAVL